jgi:hypothetical protein
VLATVLEMVKCTVTVIRNAPRSFARFYNGANSVTTCVSRSVEFCFFYANRYFDSNGRFDQNALRLANQPSIQFENPDVYRGNL